MVELALSGYAIPTAVACHARAAGCVISLVCSAIEEAFIEAVSLHHLGAHGSSDAFLALFIVLEEIFPGKCLSFQSLLFDKVIKFFDVFSPRCRIA